jgi:hypothetical protein
MINAEWPAQVRQAISHRRKLVAASFEAALKAALAHHGPCCIKVHVELDPLPPEELQLIALIRLQAPEARMIRAVACTSAVATDLIETNRGHEDMRVLL